MCGKIVYYFKYFMSLFCIVNICFCVVGYNLIVFLYGIFVW